MGQKGGQAGVARTNMATTSVEGERFGRLTALEEDGRKWRFRCDCGNIVSFPLPDVITGEILDCGCSGAVKRPNTNTMPPPKGKCYAPESITRYMVAGKQYRLELQDGSTMLVKYEKRELGVIYLYNQNFNAQTGLRPFVLKDYNKTWRLYPARVNATKTYKKGNKQESCPYNEGVMCDKQTCVSCGWYIQYLKGAIKREQQSEAVNE